MAGKKTAAVLLAGGHGSRMRSKTPKQFLLLAGHTVLWHALKALSESEIDEIVLVTPRGEAETLLREYREDQGFHKLIAATEGGAERCDSVFAGLTALRERGTELVFIHDAARPFVSQELLTRMREAGERYGAAVPVLPVKDTIKLGNAEGFVADTPPRALLFAAQTPQVFSYAEICAAYEAYDRARKAEDARALLATDDAQVMERFGACPVKLVGGEEQNQKLTTPEDMARAELWLKSREMRH
ncbi:2-C-methyl-D-erythritol 4-phosphate cytidylyltransferase [Stomatobaculum longum]|jgi:2-C-methyl-D-erythritol 4-phosphate cytidylyltransferase|uniref:2-C-methyl-D-erythritol 4-phosphate cytidylyltransferase n=1 Tax=Stomatobaculum longum TaxID=796942 RepID=UPI0028E72959|nr:2-C-methyl-D-erythritol 4-phosphate cytidylyltransferase [Stomatobaculum longum]